MNQSKTVHDLSPKHQLAIRAAASGACSGRLKEWPVLAEAFRELGYDLGLATGCALLCEYARLELSKIEPPDQTELASLKEALASLAKDVLEQGRYLRHIVQLLGLEEGDLHG